MNTPQPPQPSKRVLNDSDAKMQRARIALVLDQPFFATLLLGLKVKVDSTGQVTQTMATDGESLWWHPPFVAGMTERQIATVLAHEALHCALLHPLRRGDRDQRQWNIACDHAVNLVLEACNEAARQAGKPEPFPWPDCDVLRDPAYKGQSAEQIYTAPAPPDPNDGDEPGDGAGQGIGGVLDAPGDEADQQAHEANWKVALTQAAQAAKQQGTLPAGMARLVDETLNPPARWQDILRAFVRAAAKDDYSWTRPNTRYLHTGFILPSLYSQRLGRIALAIDTSGSIQGALLERFLSECEAIAAECRPESITLLDCDAAVNSVRECDPCEPLPRDFAGGGGTDFCPVFQELDKAEPPVCLIYLTDLQGMFPDAAPSYPVIWAAYGTEDVAPFGQTIRLDMAD